MNDTQEKYTKMFLSGPILGPLVRFALPLMLSLLLQALYGSVDLADVGQFSPTASVSAVATGSQVMQSVTVLITGLTMGVTVLLGKAVGANDAKAAGEVVSGQIRLFTIVAAALTFVMLLLAPQAAQLMNVPEEALPETRCAMCASVPPGSFSSPRITGSAASFARSAIRARPSSLC